MTKNRSQFDRILAVLKRAAPAMNVSDALSLAEEFQNNYDEMMIAAEALAILSETVLGYGRDGFGERYKDQRPGVQLALEHVGYRNAWVSCGPVKDGMGKLLDEWDARAAEAKR